MQEIQKSKKKSTSTSVVDSKPTTLTVGLFRKILKQYPKDLPLIYCRDDEGNEYQRVAFGPTTVFVKNTDYEYGRFQKIYNDKEMESRSNSSDFKKVVIIN